MGKPNEGPIWDLEPHTAAKHEILRRYLEAWFPIMGRYNGRIVYIDGFAGPGVYSKGEPGSPLIALDTALRHKQLPECEIAFFFIELDEERFLNLRTVVEGYDLPDRVTAQVHHGAFDGSMAEALDALEQQGVAMAPAFVFIDPFGFKGTPMAIVRRIVAHRGAEVLINFTYESVNRWLSHPNEAILRHMDDLFGTGEWRAASELSSAQEREAFLHDLYHRQLLAAGVSYARSFKMVDRGNKTEYFLFFGTNHVRGLEKMKDAMWRVDDAGQYEFSDATDFGQQLLFEPEPDYRALEAAILERFAGQEVSVGAVRHFVVTETPFRAAHFKRQVLRPLEHQGRIQGMGERRGLGFFPDGVRIRFLPPDR